MKSKKYIVSILLIVISVIFNTMTYAEDSSCKLLLNVGKNEVAPGTTVDVTLKISDINAGDGIVMVSGLVEYDETAFEKIEYTESANWEKTAIENYIYMNTSTLEATKENQDVLKLTLTTKEIVSDGTYKVSFKGIDITTDDGVFTIADIEVNVNVKKPSNDENQGESKDENKDDNKNDMKFITVNNATTSNTSIKSLPKTGLTIYLGIITVIIVIVVIVFYIKYKKYKC